MRYTDNITDCQLALAQPAPLTEPTQCRPLPTLPRKITKSLEENCLCEFAERVQLVTGTNFCPRFTAIGAFDRNQNPQLHW